MDEANKVVTFEKDYLNFQAVEKNFFLKGMNLNVNLEGLAFSIVDNQPQELLYGAVEAIEFKFSCKRFEKSMNIDHQSSDDQKQQTFEEEVTETDLRVGSIQIDNNQNDIVPVVLGST